MKTVSNVLLQLDIYFSECWHLGSCFGSTVISKCRCMLRAYWSCLQAALQICFASVLCVGVNRSKLLQDLKLAGNQSPFVLTCLSTCSTCLQTNTPLLPNLCHSSFTAFLKSSLLCFLHLFSGVDINQLGIQY